MSVAMEKAKTRDYEYIISNMLAPEYVDNLVIKYGRTRWKQQFKKEKLEKLPYYFGWLREGRIETEGNKTTVHGKYDCYAAFVRIEGKYYLIDFGQDIHSM